MMDASSLGQLASRAVLSAPASPRQIQILNQVILTVSALSITGAGWIILSFCVSRQPTQRITSRLLLINRSFSKK